MKNDVDQLRLELRTSACKAGVIANLTKGPLVGKERIELSLLAPKASIITIISFPYYLISHLLVMAPYLVEPLGIEPR